MASLVHFEIPADDVTRATNFYKELFGWQIRQAQGPTGPMDYWLISPDGAEENIQGGIMKRQMPNQGIINYTDVSSIEETIKKIESLKGKMVLGKTPVPGTGYFAVCMDTEKNVFGIWKADPDAFVFKEPAQAFIGIIAMIIAADGNYSVDEMRTVWYQIESIDLFAGKDYKAIESAVFNIFNKSAADPSAFTDQEMELILSAAKEMLSEKQREQAYEAALRIAHADRTVEGYKKDIDPREKAVCDRIGNELKIPEPVKSRINRDIDEKAM